MTRASGFPNWPPIWTNPRRDKDSPWGEIGTLNQALMSDLITNKVFLTIQYEGNRYVGSMAFDDERFCYDIFSLFFIVNDIFCEKKQGGPMQFEYIFQCGFIAIFEFMYPYFIIQAVEVHSVQAVNGL